MAFVCESVQDGKRGESVNKLVVAPVGKARAGALASAFGESLSCCKNFRILFFPAVVLASYWSEF